MRGMKHPLTGAMYEICDEGVRVTHGDREGIFDNDGRWIAGDRISACPNLCGWIGRGPRQPMDLSDNRRFRSVMDDQGGKSS
ncbi:MAG: hypothetical protein QOJ08_1964 [Ilumatobacteraceae bacterium]